MDRVARRGPLARAPGALTSHNAEILKGGPFGIFQHPFCRETSKTCRGEGPFEEKNPKKNVSQCRKKLKGGTLWSRPVWYVTRKNR